MMKIKITEVGKLRTCKDGVYTKTRRFAVGISSNVYFKLDVTSEKTPLVVGKSYIVNKFLREGETGVRIHNNSEVIRTFSDSTTTTNLTTSPSVLTGLCRFLVTEDCGNQSLAGRYSASGRVTKVINS